MSTKTSYIVGHYIQYYVSRDFHKDFTHEDYGSALSYEVEEKVEDICEMLGNCIGHLLITGKPKKD